MLEKPVPKIRQNPEGGVIETLAQKFRRKILLHSLLAILAVGSNPVISLGQESVPELNNLDTNRTTLITDNSHQEKGKPQSETDKPMEKALELKNSLVQLFTSMNLQPRYYGDSVLFEKINKKGEEVIAANFQIFPNSAEITVSNEYSHLMPKIQELINQKGIYSSSAFIKDSLPGGDFGEALTIQINTNTPQEFLDIKAEPVGDTVAVAQNEYIVTKSNDPNLEDIKYLATWGAGPCKIIIITQKNTDGSVIVAMAHDQKEYVGEQIAQMLERGGFDASKVSLYISNQDGMDSTEETLLKQQFPNLQVSKSSSAQVNRPLS